MADAALAAFFSSASVLVLPLMVTYLGSNPFSTSTPSSRVGRSRRCPTAAFTSYPEPRYLPMVLALVGDSTMTSAGRPSPRIRAPLVLARLTLGVRAVFPVLRVLVAIDSSVSIRLTQPSSRQVARNPHLRAKCKNQDLRAPIGRTILRAVLPRP